jgi:hypothetical protein
MGSSPIEKLRTYGARAINKSASSILSKKKRPQKLSKKARQKLNQADELVVRRCVICKLTYKGSIVTHKLTQFHKKNKLKDMLKIKRPEEKTE